MYYNFVNFIYYVGQEKIPTLCFNRFELFTLPSQRNGKNLVLFSTEGDCNKTDENLFSAKKLWETRQLLPKI